jgi:hypothetical protein
LVGVHVAVYGTTTQLTREENDLKRRYQT